METKLEKNDQEQNGGEMDAGGQPPAPQPTRHDGTPYADSIRDFFKPDVRHI